MAHGLIASRSNNSARCVIPVDRSRLFHRQRVVRRATVDRPIISGQQPCGEHGRHVGRASQRFDTAYVNLIQLLDPAEDAVEFIPQPFDLVLLDADAGESGNAADGRMIERHGGGNPYLDEDGGLNEGAGP